uniref:CSON012427 protein n=1 Tax=Culicoides sonorensis TaxID=179676 RepID=A0A336M5H8_CULSO
MYLSTIFLLLNLISLGYCGVLSAVFNFFKKSHKHKTLETDDQKILNVTYDFIVIGAGSAGAVMASRLSENQNWNVLLLEAGGAESFLMDIPQNVHLLQQTGINWDYKTEPSDSYCLGMIDNQCRWPRGKVMGGSSVLNYMIYTRGNRNDFNGWAKRGCDSWDYKNVLNYFKKIEDSDVYETFPDYRGRGGNVGLTKEFWRSPASEFFLRAGMELGYPTVDYNGPTQIGVSFVESNIKNGHRHSSNVAYLYPVRDRPNLHVKKNAQVTKILINPFTKTAEGVEYYHENELHKVFASKEIILSAGAVNSPQLLMLSGIGPIEHLTEMGIKVISNLPVGYNLMDHIAPMIVIACDSCLSPSAEFSRAFTHLINYFDNSTGPLNNPGGCESLLFLDSQSTRPSINGIPDLELLQTAGGINFIISSNMGLKRDIIYNMYRYSDVRDKNTFMVLPMVLRPKSRGRIYLRDTDPLSPPKIIPNYFADPYDMELAIIGIRKIQELLQTQAMRNIGAQVVDLKLPGCLHLPFDTDIYWECYFRHLTFNIYHYSGTCKMGSHRDFTSVVTPRLNVRGIRNLRVVDASVMPEIVSVNSQLIDSLLQFWGKGQSMLWQEKPDQTKLDDTYDFIIVGAGSAGCVLANRLSEMKNWKILLIEAGGSENLLMDVPQIVHLLQQLDVNWGYKTAPSNKYCRGMVNHQCNWPRGKVMGGSSVLNYMIYTRGNPRDYDNWSKMGNNGWDYANVLPYFNKIETAHLQGINMTAGYRGTNGPITVSTDFWRSRMAKAFIKAGLEMGMPMNDYNGPTQIGISPIQSNLKRGFRQSANVAYLYPIQNRPNLHVKKHSLVTKLIFDKSNKVITGVKFIQDKRTFYVRAKREVIISAGAINSPQLLMLSGIGPAKHLKKFDINPIVNLPVGYNLMDHAAPGAITLLCNHTNTDFNRVMDQFNMNFVNFMQRAKGPITGPGGCESVLFYDSDNPTSRDGYADIELLQLGGSVTSFPTFRNNFGIDPYIYETMWGDLESQAKGAFMVFPMVLRPKSRGRIMLKSDSPQKFPVIYPNYYQNHKDIETSIKGIRLLQKMLQTDAMKQLNVRMLERKVPGCENYVFDSDEYWECYTRTFTFTIYHYSGTCKMGPPSDKEAVVSPRLRVYNISNLRVVDASIMPEIIAGHPNGPTMMIAEKAADMIKEDWHYT